ncbi:hypothetical protein AVEN_50569-1 [Araneus ventricosus]|uniref:DUF19 domain-containing protein n=1 Tax=Araneus ventricosus TaxID=182803 RepID=A0A4Y2APY8_ARAVE|nr:hypothetical protein AVEN_50569-1 [Araneus ventricosus]
MKTKTNFIFLCAFCFFAIVHSETPSADELKKYYSCWEYALCEDLFSAIDIDGCLNTLKPKELQSFFQFLSNNYYSFNSNSLIGKISEYCSYDNDKKHDVFDKIVDSSFAFMKKASDEGNDGTQSRTKKAILCVYNVVQNLQSDGNC